MSDRPLFDHTEIALIEGQAALRNAGAAIEQAGGSGARYQAAADILGDLLHEHRMKRLYPSIPRDAA